MRPPAAGSAADFYGSDATRCVSGPSRADFSDHAAERADQYDVPYEEAADADLEGHSSRRRNAGRANWQVQRGRLVVVYDWPVQGDPTLARIRSLWLRG